MLTEFCSSVAKAFEATQRLRPTPDDLETAQLKGDKKRSEVQFASLYFKVLCPRITILPNLFINLCRIIAIKRLHHGHDYM